MPMEKKLSFKNATLLVIWSMKLLFSVLFGKKTEQKRNANTSCSNFEQQFSNSNLFIMKKPALASVFFIFLFSLGVQQSVFGQVSITSLPQTYTQNFNQLSSTAATSWTNNTTATLPNWYISPSITSLFISTGSNTSGAVLNLGVAGFSAITDRALGCLQSGGNAQYFGVRLKNNSSTAIASFDISFTGEQWRQNNAGSLIFEYQVASSVTALTGGTWLPATQFDFAAPNNGTAGPLNGNNPANRTAISNTLTVNVPAGSEIMFRWSRTTNSSPILAIDDLIIQANSAGSPPPSLTAAVSATVDAPFDVTFTDNATWRTAISSISVGGTTLSASAYAVSAGKITFTPSAATLLQAAGSKSIIVSATGYNNATVTQTIGAGAANKLSMNTQPTAPTANGGTLATQPKVTVLDQYGNATTSTASITAAVGAGTWTIGGTTTVSASAGVATFTNLTATSAAAVTGATITFSSTGLTGVTSNTFNIPGPSPVITGATTATTFTTTYGTASAVQNFAVSGANLTANLVATAPTGFEVSADGTTYGTTATFTQTAGSASGTLSVRLKATATVAGSYNSKNIVLSSTGATNVNITTSASGNSVARKALTITANNQSVFQGTAVNTVTGAGTYTATGFVNGENASVLSGSVTYNTTYTTSTVAGTSGVTITPVLSLLSAANYTLTPADGVITIIPLQSPPILTAASNATVDAPFDVTFTDDSAWRAAITQISINGTTLTDGYAALSGKITFTPSASVPASLLQTGTANKNIVIKANGYNDAPVTQSLGHGVPAKLLMVTQPVAPNTNGGVLSIQPELLVVDQYGNLTESTATVTATVGAGAWIIGGTTAINAVSGTLSYSGLTASNIAAVTGATITFTSPGLTSVTSAPFNLGAPLAVATLATNVNATSFTANWNAMPGAASYELDVYTKISNTTPTEATVTNVFANNGYTNAETLPSGTISSGLLSFTTEQNDSGTAPAYYDTGAGIRLYGNTLAGNGNTFTLNITGGITVTKVDFVTGSGTQTANYAYYVDNATTAAGTGTFTNTPGTTSISGLSAISKFVIQNTTLTGRSAARLSKIVVTYTYNGTSIVETPITNSPFSVTVPTIFKDVTGLTPSTTYYYRVRAKNGSTSSANSNEIQVITRPDTTIWDGNTWSNEAPALDMNAIVNGALPMTTSLEAKSITVNSGGSVIVTTGKTLRVANEVNNATNDATKFIVESGAALIQNNTTAENVGPITVKRYSHPLYRQDYTLWSSPVLNQNLRNFSPQTLYNRFYSYDTSSGQNGAYVQELFTTTDVNTKVFHRAKGYLIRMPNNWPDYINSSIAGTSFEGVFVGVPNTGDITVSLSTVNNGYNLVGNPYPSPISIAAFKLANPSIGTALYFYRKRNGALGSGYGTLTGAGYVGNGANGPFSNIEVGQGFFVKANNASSLSFTNSMRVSANGVSSVFLRTTNDTPEINTASAHRFWLNLLKDNEQVGQTLIGYFEGATMAIDEALDAKYFNDSPLAVTSILANDEYIIQARSLPFDSSDVVPLGFKTDVAGTYTFIMGNKEGCFEDSTNSPIFIKDNTTGAIHNTSNGAYTFTSNAGVFNSRFEIVYTDSFLSEDLQQFYNSVIIYKHEGDLIIDAGKLPLEKVEVWDTLGRVLFTSSTNETIYKIKQYISSNQVLILKITTSKGIINKKIHY